MITGSGFALRGIQDQFSSLVLGKGVDVIVWNWNSQSYRSLVATRRCQSPRSCPNLRIHIQSPEAAFNNRQLEWWKEPVGCPARVFAWATKPGSRPVHSLESIWWGDGSPVSFCSLPTHADSRRSSDFGHTQFFRRRHVDILTALPNSEPFRSAQMVLPFGSTTCIRPGRRTFYNT